LALALAAFACNLQHERTGAIFVFVVTFEYVWLWVFPIWIESAVHTHTHRILCKKLRCSCCNVSEFELIIGNEMRLKPSWLGECEREGASFIMSQGQTLTSQRHS